MMTKSNEKSIFQEIFFLVFWISVLYFGGPSIFLALYLVLAASAIILAKIEHTMRNNFWWEQYSGLAKAWYTKERPISLRQALRAKRNIDWMFAELRIRQAAGQRTLVFTGFTDTEG